MAFPGISGLFEKLLSTNKNVTLNSLSVSSWLGWSQERNSECVVGNLPDAWALAEWCPRGARSRMRGWPSATRAATFAQRRTVAARRRRGHSTCVCRDNQSNTHTRRDLNVFRSSSSRRSTVQHRQAVARRWVCRSVSNSSFLPMAERPFSLRGRQSDADTAASDFRDTPPSALQCAQSIMRCFRRTSRNARRAHCSPWWHCNSPSGVRPTPRRVWLVP